MGSKDATSEPEINSQIKVEFDYILDLCRVCMVRNNDMKPLFKAEDNNIIEKVEFCTGVTFAKEDSLPSNICCSCLENLTIAYQFKTACITSEEAFRKVLTQVKTEEPEYAYDDGIDDVDDDVKDVLKEVLELNKVKVKKVKKEGESTVIQPKPERKKRKPYTRRQPAPTREKKQDAEQQNKQQHSHGTHWMCEICGKMFVHRSSHHTHLKSHMPPQYNCDACDYKTWHKCDLVKHIRIHTGVKRFQCEFCTNSYYTSSNLLSHIRSFHERVKRFQCHLCDRAFYDKTKLNRHVDSHNDIKRFECSLCNSCFTRRCYWKKHVSRAHGVAIPRMRPGKKKNSLVLEVPA